jgi:two-component system, NarL family, sensor histidine kinase DesK
MTDEPDRAVGGVGGVGASGGDPADTSILGAPRDGQLRPLFGVVAVLFIAFPIINLSSTSADAVEVVLVVVATALFAGLMLATSPFLGVRPPSASEPPRPFHGAPSARRIVLSTAAVVVLLGIAVFLSVRYPDSGWFALFYYASTGASTIRSTRVAIPLMVIAGVLASLTFFAADRDIGGAVVQGLSVTIIGLTVFSAIAVRRTNRQLVAARHELARLAVADERARIARDMHDTLGHNLSVIALKSELAGRLVDDDPERAKAEIAEVQQVARESLSAVRETIGGFRQPTLATELAGARRVLAAAGIDGRVEPAPDGIPPTADAVLGWAVREGVTNVVRHGQAASARVSVELTGGSAAVDIWNDRPKSGGGSDDGRDQDDGEASRAPGVGGGGSGLAGLRERVAAVGGVVEAGPVAGGGFRLRVSVPIA